MAQQPMYPGQVNSPQTELASAIDDVQTTVPVMDASVLPAAPNLLVIGGGEDAETILYTGISGDNLTGVTRGFQGAAKAWGSGVKVGRFFTAYDHDAFKNNIADHETRVTSIYDDVDHRGVNIRREGADPTGTEDSSSVIVSILANANAAFLPEGEYLISEDITIPAGKALAFAPGAKIKPASGVTVTIYGQIEANPFDHIFDLSLGGNISMTTASVDWVYPQWFGAVNDYNPTTGEGTDNSDAFEKALAAFSRVFVLRGRYKITRSLNVASGKQLIGFSRSSSVIVQTSDNIPIFYSGGEGIRIGDLRLEYKNFQPSANKWGNAIHVQKLYESVIERLSVSNAASFIYCERYSTSDTDTSQNYIYSTTIRDIRISNYSRHIMYLSSINAGNTGCIFSNIYSNNWDNFEQGTKRTAINGFVFKNFSESFASQLNVEHTKLTNCFVFDNCESFKLISFHIEGADNNNNYNAFFDIQGSNVEVDTGMVSFSNVSVANIYGLVRFKNTATGDTAVFRNIKIRNVTVSGGGSGYLLYAGAETNAGSVSFENVKYDNFSQVFVQNNNIFPPLVRRINEDLFYYKVGGKVITYGTLMPTTGTWNNGDEKRNTLRIEEGDPGSKYVVVGWTCIASGTPGTWVEMKVLTGN
ncbi:hypothetical protein EXW96_26515 [Paenibacillus sp. JMULE4]|uniref:hypothetical protein n=1 Tax=Paenibacillus sp. JMULE4 TaxID=2518342 RepID=UPI001576B40D|nr:hypothetical protein [Paenibacillus sp. JMULE4]NTZ20944.1 hypothetical protein [Paenibacillus sp. JMULE4]